MALHFSFTYLNSKYEYIRSREESVMVWIAFIWLRTGNRVINFLSAIKYVEYFDKRGDCQLIRFWTIEVVQEGAGESCVQLRWSGYMQSVPITCVHIIIRHINLVYLFLWHYVHFLYFETFTLRQTLFKYGFYILYPYIILYTLRTYWFTIIFKTFNITYRTWIIYINRHQFSL